MQPWGKWAFATKGSLEEREYKAAILDELYAMMLPKVGGAVVGMERVRGADGGDSCLMLQWQEGSKDYFWVGGEGQYPYFTDLVLRRLGMEGTKAMHALVCEWLHGEYERKETVVVDGVEEVREVVKVVMHTCEMGGVKRRRGRRGTCCILPWHLRWGTVKENVGTAQLARQTKRKERGAILEKAREVRRARAK